MQVQRVQNNNTRPMFTSKVHMDFETAEYLGKAAKRGIKELLNNGQKDVVFISLQRGEMCPSTIKMDVVRKKGKELLWGNRHGLHTDSIPQIYADATKEMKPIDKNSIYYMI